MRVNFGHPVSWAFGLGVLAAAIAGSTVPASTAAEEARQVIGYFLMFGPAVYFFVTRRRTYWTAKHPYIRFVVFLLTMTVTTVVLVRLVGGVLGETGIVAGVVGLLAGLSGFAVTVWVTFYGGAELVWQVFLSRTDLEW